MLSVSVIVDSLRKLNARRIMLQPVYPPLKPQLPFASPTRGDYTSPWPPLTGTGTAMRQPEFFERMQ